MEAIPSGVKFGRATVGQGERPKHTNDDHRACAYYVKLGETGEYFGGEDGKGSVITPFIEMECPHGFSAGGAFYSEDFVFELRQLAHAILAEARHWAHPDMRKSANDIEKNSYRMSHPNAVFLGPVEVEDVGKVRLLLEELEEMTK